jgi:hypothetical protein
MADHWPLTIGHWARVKRMVSAGPRELEACSGRFEPAAEILSVAKDLAQQPMLFGVAEP